MILLEIHLIALGDDPVIMENEHGIVMGVDYVIMKNEHVVAMGDDHVIITGDDHVINLLVHLVITSHNVRRSLDTDVSGVSIWCVVWPVTTIYVTVVTMRVTVSSISIDGNIDRLRATIARFVTDDVVCSSHAASGTERGPRLASSSA